MGPGSSRPGDRPEDGGQLRAVNGARLRTEHELLLCVARTRDAETHAERARALVHTGVDWASTLMLALDHGVMPLLYRNFFILGPQAAPDRFVRDLRALYLANTYRNLSLTAELGRVLALFEVDGLPVVAYGGPVLAALAYGDTALRQTSNLEVLVGRADLGRAADILRGAGYVPRVPMTPAQARRHERRTGMLTFTLADPEVVLNVHWRFGPDGVSGGPEPRGALENRRRAPFGGRTVPSLDPDDMLFVLVLEGTRARWGKLATICDVAELLQSRPGWEWPGLVGRAGTEGLLRRFLLGVSLAAELLAVPVPREVLSRAARDPDVSALRRWAAASLFSEAGVRPSYLAVLGFETRSLDARRARVAYCWRRTLVPTPSDWRWLHLPDVLYLVYYLVRPLRLAVEGVIRPLLRRLRLAFRRSRRTAS
jgi:Uncharacterised nucleotidyltransferase